MVSCMPESGFDMPACLERIRHGDDEAARMLFHHLHPLVIKIVRSHLPKRTSDEDLAQTVFMKIFANLDQYSDVNTNSDADPYSDGNTNSDADRDSDGNSD